jgi:hypothetical protein
LQEQAAQEIRNMRNIARADDQRSNDNFLNRCVTVAHYNNNTIAALTATLAHTNLNQPSQPPHPGLFHTISADEIEDMITRLGSDDIDSPTVSTPDLPSQSNQQQPPPQQPPLQHPPPQQPPPQQPPPPQQQHLNNAQAAALQLFETYYQQLVESQVSTRAPKPQPLRILVHGGPGVGKTFFINRLIALTIQFGFAIPCAAYMGSAAAMLQGGRTLHGLLGIFK